MSRTFKILTSVLVAAAFIAASVFCCCIQHLIKEQTTAKSCCHAKSEKSNSSKTTCDGCNATVKSAEASKILNLTPLQITFSYVPIPVAVFKPQHVFLKSAFLHGPPGPIAIVPLYIQFHSLRI